VIHTTLFIVFYLSNCNILYQSIFITLQDIQNYSNSCNRCSAPQRKFWFTYATENLVPRLLEVKMVQSRSHCISKSVLWCYNLVLLNVNS